MACILNIWFHFTIFFLFTDNLTLSRLGSLMSLKDRPLPRTPTELASNNNFYSVPKHLHPTQTTPVTSPNTTPWATPKTSPRMDHKSISSETDTGSMSKGMSGVKYFLYLHSYLPCANIILSYRLRHAIILLFVIRYIKI